jgi:hypothetical protein
VPIGVRWTFVAVACACSALAPPAAAAPRQPAENGEVPQRVLNSITMRCCARGHLVASWAAFLTEHRDDDSSDDEEEEMDEEGGDSALEDEETYDDDADDDEEVDEDAFDLAGE